MWTQQGSGALGVDHPVTLTYDNGAGLVFARTIAVDDHYLFTIKDAVTNKSVSAVTLFPYALISRRGTPNTLGYYILHEGLIGVMGNHGLQEETYKKIEDKKSESWDVTDAWLGFTDRYWATAMLPDTDAKVHARFTAREAGGEKTYQTDYLLEPVTVAPGATGSADARLFAGAKEVSVVGINFLGGIDGGYNAALGLNHFDLLIEWGFISYFIAKPMFLMIDYFYRLVGNLGVAILIFATYCQGHRQAPVLRQPILRSMIKIKRYSRKSLIKRTFPRQEQQHQEILELYKTENVTPPAGCLPIVIQSRCSSRSTRCCSSPSRCDTRRSTAGSTICRRRTRPTFLPSVA